MALLTSRTDRPEVELRIDGQPAPPRLNSDVVEIDVTEEVRRHGRCSLLLQNWDPDRREVRWSDEGPLQPGVGVEVLLGYGSDLVSVFSGVVTGLTGHFTGDQAPTLQVEARSRSILLEVSEQSRIVADTSDGDLFSLLATDAGLEADTAEGAQRPVAVLEREPAWTHVVARARELGWIAYVRDRTLVARPPAPPEDPVELAWTRNLVELRVAEDVSRLPASWTVTGWDPTEQQQVEAAPGSATGGLDTGDRASYADAVSTAGWPARDSTVSSPAIGDQAAADLVVEGLAREAELRHVTGFARVVGVPGVRCDSWVTVTGVGDRFSGPFYLSSVRHRLGRTGYTTELGLGLAEAVGQPGPPAPAARGRLLVGVVTDVDDPEQQGRVQVSLPWGAGSDAVWARLATPYAGDRQGFFVVPDVGQEVLVDLLDGRADHPVVLGSLWSGAAAPPYEPGSDNAVRAWRTASGHELAFTEGDQGGVTLTTAGGHVVALSDEDASVTITASGAGNSVTLSDAGIELKAAQGDLTLSAPAGAVRIEGMSIAGKADTTASLEASATFDIKASATLGLRGALVNIN